MLSMLCFPIAIQDAGPLDLRIGQTFCVDPDLKQDREATKQADGDEDKTPGAAELDGYGA